MVVMVVALALALALVAAAVVAAAAAAAAETSGVLGHGRGRELGAPSRRTETALHADRVRGWWEGHNVAAPRLSVPLADVKMHDVALLPTLVSERGGVRWGEAGLESILALTNRNL